MAISMFSNNTMVTSPKTKESSHETEAFDVAEWEHSKKRSPVASPVSMLTGMAPYLCGFTW